MAVAVGGGTLSAGRQVGGLKDTDRVSTQVGGCRSHLDSRQAGRWLWFTAGTTANSRQDTAGRRQAGRQPFTFTAGTAGTTHSRNDSKQQGAGWWL